MKPVRYGIIGAGVIANAMAKAFQETPDSVAVADVNCDAAQNLADEVGVTQIYVDYHEMLADPEIDAVYIATPPFLHKPMTIDALRAGKHVCCEPPFVLTRQEVVDVIEVNKTVPHLKVISCSSRYQNSGTAKSSRHDCRW